ncbi:MAG: [acyl-carrier-protein] S-malonyltransferase [Alphaproteobacteria bacterium]|nr:[acyl-carrier-protein] S-malonyltransferase [Alphaproteobacteria bacterium]
MTRAFLFPGQGSQFVGMGKDLAEAFPAARQTFEEVDDALGDHLSRVMWEGPEDKLNLTENTQPALLAVSTACMRVMTREANIRLDDVITFAAGHSLGEYSALTATGALDLADTARLVRLRGQAMQSAVPVGIGAMAAILGLDFAEVQEIAKRAAGSEVCQAANDNSTGQVVISGHAGAVEAAIAMASEMGAKRAVKLPVSAPFHSTLMAPAAQRMAQALADTDIRPPIVPVVSNVTARGAADPHEIRRLLVDQITGMVRWRESVQWMRGQGVDEMVEIGAGKVLAGLVKRIEKDVQAESVGTPEQLDALIQRLA